MLIKHRSVYVRTYVCECSGRSNGVKEIFIFLAHLRARRRSLQGIQTYVCATRQGRQTQPNFSTIEFINTKENPSSLSWRPAWPKQLHPFPAIPLFPSLPSTGNALVFLFSKKEKFYFNSTLFVWFFFFKNSVQKWFSLCNEGGCCGDWNKSGRRPLYQPSVLVHPVYVAAYAPIYFQENVDF